MTRDISYDPLEGLNRVTHGLNKAADAVALRPASSVYAAVTPDIVERSVYNFSENLDHPLRVVNSVLQGRPYDAGRNFTRFLVNSTFGLGGLFDPASDMGFENVSTDFGETLYVWGAGEGAYVELPFFGPSNVRDTIGRAADTMLNPTRLVNLTETETRIRGGVRVADLLGRRSDAAPFLDPLLYESTDSYVAIRNASKQARRAELGDTDADIGLDPFDDGQRGWRSTPHASSQGGASRKPPCTSHDDFKRCRSPSFVVLVGVLYGQGRP